MVSGSSTGWRRLPLLTAWAMYALIVMGAVVRATGSGLGCPDWPTCHGSWIPPLQREAIIEYTHRSLATVVGVLVAAVAWSAVRRRRSEPQRVWMAGVALLLLGVQAGLGRQVVLAELAPGLVSVHLAMALVLLGLMVLLALPGPLERILAGDLRLWLPALGVLVVAVLGGALRAEAATFAFTDWPLMDGGLLPDRLDDLPRLLHFLHRLAAGILWLGVVAWALSLSRSPGRLARHAAWLAGLVTMQAAFGAFVVLGRLPRWAVVGHVAFGAAAWAVAVLIGTNPSPIGSRPSSRRVETGTPGKSL